MWFIGVEVQQETSAPPPKKNPGSAPVWAMKMAMFQAKKTKKSERHHILYLGLQCYYDTSHFSIKLSHAADALAESDQNIDKFV